MITLRRSKWGIPYLQRWFARRGRLGDWLGITAYRQFLGSSPGPWWIRRPFSTSIIDLSRTEEELFSSIHRDDRTKINRADREGLQWIGTDAPAPADRDDFISRYRAFAQEKRIAPLSRSQLESFGNSLFLSKALREDHWVSPLYALAEKLGRL